MYNHPFDRESESESESESETSMLSMKCSDTIVDYDVSHMQIVIIMIIWRCIYLLYLSID